MLWCIRECILALSLICLVSFKANMQHTSIGFRQSLYQSCRARRDIHLNSWWLFYLKLFEVHKLFFKFLEFWTSNFLNLSDDLRWRYNLNQSCSTRRDIKLFSSNFFHLKLFRLSNIRTSLRGVTFPWVSSALKETDILGCCLDGVKYLTTDLFPWWLNP